jgi:hypothetical protein
MTYIHAHSRTLLSKGRISAVARMFYVGRVSLIIMLLMFITVLSVIYLINFNAKATIGYELSKLEFQRDELLNTREQKNLDLSRSQSLDYIRDSLVVQSMVNPEEVVYFDGKTAVALR